MLPFFATGADLVKDVRLQVMDIHALIAAIEGDETPLQRRFPPARNPLEIRGWPCEFRKADESTDV